MKSFIAGHERINGARVGQLCQRHHRGLPDAGVRIVQRAEKRREHLLVSTLPQRFDNRFADLAVGICCKRQKKPHGLGLLLRGKVHDRLAAGLRLI
ncbi:MAG TPA: hypothetical protein VN887_05725 [Candidatus Angelobacter sp.]|nr:hypothetical protein [Candidatus Angelobacter sp.]